MNYILRESNDGKHLLLRPDRKGRILNTKEDIGDRVKMFINANRYAVKYHDVMVSSNKELLITEAKKLLNTYPELTFREER